MRIGVSVHGMANISPCGLRPLRSTLVRKGRPSFSITIASSEPKSYVTGTYAAWMVRMMRLCPALALIATLGAVIGLPSLAWPWSLIRK